jgi:hypothetical protein
LKIKSFYMVFVFNVLKIPFVGRLKIEFMDTHIIKELIF